MPIRVKCKCERTLVAPEKLAGKTVKCPNCSQPLMIPATAEPAAQAPAEPATGAATEPQRPSEAPESPPCPSCKQPFPADKQVCEHCLYSRRLKKRMKDPKNQPVAAKKPKPTKPKKNKKPRTPIFRFNGLKVLGGVLTMLASVAWLVGGLAAGRLFFYPIILFCIGFGIMLNGIFGEDHEMPLGGD